MDNTQLQVTDEVTEQNVITSQSDEIICQSIEQVEIKPSMDMMLSSIEWVDMVSYCDKSGLHDVIAQMPRSTMRLHKLLHRATYLIVHDGNQNILVQKRTSTKDYYPGFWDAAAGGVVQAGEDWLPSIKREAAEELGITDVPFVDHGEFYYAQGKDQVLGRLYSCISKGPFDLQVSEVDKVLWQNIADILANPTEFTPDSIFALERWMNRHLVM